MTYSHCKCQNQHYCCRQDLGPEKSTGLSIFAQQRVGITIVLLNNVPI